MSNKLDALKAAFGKSNENQNQSFGEQYPFWQMKDGEQAVIRFLPDADENNPLAFLVEKLMHKLNINGQRRSVPCLKMYGEKDCPICALSAQYYKDGDKINGKKYWRNKQHLARALIIKDPLPIQEGEESYEGKIKTITLSFQLYESINQAFQSGELDEVPFAFEGGCDFIIKKKVVKDGNNEYASYVYSTFARKTSDLNPNSIELKDLSSFIPDKIEYDELAELLEADITGSDIDNSTNDRTSNSSGGTVEDKLSALKSTNATTVEDKNVEDEADAILAEIMNNR